jgi:hypothetical protein
VVVEKAVVRGAVAMVEGTEIHNYNLKLNKLDICRSHTPHNNNPPHSRCQCKIPQHRDIAHKANIDQGHNLLQ